MPDLAGGMFEQRSDPHFMAKVVFRQNCLRQHIDRHLERLLRVLGHKENALQDYEGYVNAQRRRASGATEIALAIPCANYQCLIQN